MNVISVVDLLRLKFTINNLNRSRATTSKLLRFFVFNMENNLEVSSWYTYNNYFKGDLSDLQIWNKGDISFVEKKVIPLHLSNGEFYKNEIEKKYITKKADIRVDVHSCEGKAIIQIDYDFYLVPIAERLSIIDGRDKLKSLLKDYGLVGFTTYKSFYREIHHYSFERTKYDVDRPIEICFCEEHRANTKKFMEFNYNEYIENYNKALIKYPNHKKTLDHLKFMNINIICDFYMITEKELSSNKFDRLKHAIKVLHKKITNNLKN